MPRFKITLQYDGADYFGWQMQASERTVQGEVEACIAPFNDNNRVKVIGAGRTDTGVHAWGQVAHFDLKTELDTCTLTDAFNARLPNDIYVTDLRVVPGDFHARYSAKVRHYRYQCLMSVDILMRNQTWIIDDLSVDHLQQCVELIKGEHDFKSFCKSNPEVNHTRCIIYHTAWINDEKMLTFRISGNRFLHHMVRYLVGSMVAVAQRRLSLEEFKMLLNQPNKNVHIFKAPAQGLILEKVDYDEIT